MRPGESDEVHLSPACVFASLLSQGSWSSILEPSEASAGNGVIDHSLVETELDRGAEPLRMTAGDPRARTALAPAPARACYGPELV